MSLRRWAGTTVVMAAVAWALWSSSPGPAELQAVAADPQGLVDRAGPDALVLVVVPVLGWLCWAWGALGLLLTAASAVPGSLGRLAGVLLTGVVPAGARRAAAVALGVGLSTAAPAVLLPAAVSVTSVVTAAADQDVAGADGVDWPAAASSDVVPDWPGPAKEPTWPSTSTGDHVVLRGDCLWDIAEDWLARRTPATTPTEADVRQAVQAWWQANAAVIGGDPDLLLPGQVLRPPG